MAGDEGLPRDFPLALADTGRDQHCAMGGLFQEGFRCRAEFIAFNTRRQPFLNHALRIARVGEEAPRALHLQYRMGFQQIVVADRREVADPALPQIDRQIAQDREKLGVRPLLP